MKNIITNINEAMALVESISQFDAEGMQTIICMLVDTCAARHGMDAREIADTVKTLVYAVNSEFGAYRIA